MSSILQPEWVNFTDAPSGGRFDANTYLYKDNMTKRSVMIYDLSSILIVCNIFQGNINITARCHAANDGQKTAAADVLLESLIKCSSIST